MKLFRFLLIIFIPFFSKAQDYQLFPTENAFWGVEFEWDGEDATEYYSFELVADTIIDNQTYKKLSQSLAIYRPFHINQWEHFNKIPIFFREEDKKIYFYDIFDLKEYLFYDFSVEVNDTFVYKLNDSLLVVKEFELYGRRGIRLKKLNNPYQGHFYTVDWIEGMGSLDGLQYPIGFAGGDAELSCFQHDDFSPLDCSDFNRNVSISDLKEEAITIYPNPVTSYFYCNSEYQIQLIEIFSIQGKLIQKLEPNDKYEIDNTLLNGIYIFKIYTDNEVLNKKILIN